jgi:CheY-like chemotaxis protein
MSLPATLLVVHPDASVHALAREALDPAEWHIDSAHNSAEAVACLEARPYDLILAAVPEADDEIPLLSRMHRLRPEAKIVLSSAANGPKQMIEALRAGATCCMREPFSRHALRESLATVFNWEVNPDDIEILSDRPEWIALRIRSKIETAERLTHFFRLMLGDLKPVDRDAIVTGMRELLINAIEHGSHLDPENRVHVTYIRTQRSVVCYIRDPGEGFSLENIPHAAISNPDSPLEHVDRREQMGSRPGGFGILMAQKFADELVYSAKGNEVLMIRYLEPLS